MSDSEPVSPSEILAFFSSEERSEYMNWKKKLFETKDSNPGVISLLKNLQNAEDKGTGTDFLNFLCEFNHAIFLIKRGFSFGYEQDGDDFSVEDMLIGIKSLQPKGYARKEEAMIFNARQRAMEKGKPVSFHVPYKASFCEFIVQPDGGWERIEFARDPGGHHESEKKEKGKVLTRIADLEAKDGKQRKKILFLFCQSREMKQRYVEDIAKWYFEEKRRRFDALYPFYPQNLKPSGTSTSSVQRNHSIDCIVLLSRPANVLVWPKTVFDGKRLRIWGRTLGIEGDVKKLYKM